MEVNPWNIVKKYRFPLLLLGLGIVVYGNSLFGQPIWDDIGYVFENPDFQTIHILKIFTHNIYVLNGYYRPLTAFYYSILLALFGQQTFFFHAIQLTIHIANAFLLMLLLKKFLSSSFSFLLASVFLIHPLTVEAVAYIAAAEDVGSFLLGVGAVCLLVYARLAKWEYFLLFILFLGSLLIKESAIIFLILSITYALLFRKKVLRKIVLITISAFITYVLLRLGFVGISHHPSPLTPIAALPLLDRLISIPTIIFYYLSNVFFPWKLAIDQQWTITHFSLFSFYVPLSFSIFVFLVLGIFFLIFLKYKRSLLSVYIFFLVWFLVGLGMHLQIIPLDMTVADRWFYIPLAGLICLIGVITSQFVVSKKVLVGIFAVILCLLSFRTMVRNTNWVDKLTLYSHDVANTNSFELEANLAAELIDARNYDQALIHAKKSVAILPLDYNTYNLGALYEIKNNYPLARQFYYQALVAKSHPLDGHKHIKEMYEGVGEFASMHDSPQKATEVLSRGIADYPEDPVLFTYLAVVEYKLGDQQKAQKSISQAYSLVQTGNTIYVKNQIFSRLPIIVTDKHGMSQTIMPGVL